jgi:hypothetical protein
MGDVGASKIAAKGNVYHLNKLEDFDGNYTAATGGMTIAGGGSAIAMQNQNGVVRQIASTAQLVVRARERFSSRSPRGLRSLKMAKREG